MRLAKILCALLLLMLTGNVAAQGFGIGGPMNIWVNNTSGSSNNASITLPSANLQAIYSTIQYQGWGGKCLQVERTSDSATMDIGFVNGVCDIASAMTFAGGTTPLVTKWYDESGNGNDATQATAANMPVFTNFNMINNIPGVTAWNGTQLLLLPAGFSTNMQSTTVFSIHSLIAFNGLPWALNTTFSGGACLLMGDQATDDFLTNAFTSTGLYSYMQPEVTVSTFGASSATYQINEVLQTGITASPSETALGGSLFALQNSPNYQNEGQIYTVAIYSNVIGQSTIQTNKNNLYATFGINKNNATRIVYDGDSITEGYQSTQGVNKEFQVVPLLTHPADIRNVGVFGRLFSTCLSNETVNVLNSFSVAYTNNIVLIGAGINDINAGTTGASLFTTDLVPYVTAAQGAGYKVIVATLLFDAGSTGPAEIQRQAYNTLVRANAVADNYTVADDDSIVALQNPQNPADTADGLHPTSAGYGLMSVVEAAAINSVVAAR